MPHALLIDDDQFNLEVLARLLERQGCTHTDIQDVAELSPMLETLDSIDVIFLDLEMPKMDGYEVLAFLRQILGQPIPIVAYTVYSSEINTVREVGFDGFIGKPLDPQRFPQQLERILQGEAVWELA